MKRIHYTIIAAFILVASSCKKDFLDVPDKEVLLRQAYVKDLSTAGDFMNGIYATFAFNFYSGFYGVYTELAADNVRIADGQPILDAHYRWVQRADDEKTNFSSATKNLNQVWMEGYRLVRDCSFLLENIDKYRAENLQKADQLKGEAYGMRALAHFVLITTFAQSYNFATQASHIGVPYVKTSHWEDPVFRISVAEFYTEMIADVNNAITAFSSPTPTNARRMNINAAKALLARIYLFKEDYSNAKNIAREVIQAVPLMSTAGGYPGKLFTTQETEALFQLTPASFGTGESFNTAFQGVYYAAPLTFYLATKDIADLLSNNSNDRRKVWVRRGISGIDTISKFPQGVVPGYNPPSIGYYQTILRSSEMYLTCAEAYANLGAGFTDSAWYYLDAIRLRADGTASPSTATGTNLLDSIQVERRKELSFEGLRLFDLLRWKKDITRKDETNPQYKTLVYPSKYAIAPIPLSDVRAAGLKQNEGY